MGERAELPSTQRQRMINFHSFSMKSHDSVHILEVDRAMENFKNVQFSSPILLVPAILVLAKLKLVLFNDKNFK